MTTTTLYDTRTRTYRLLRAVQRVRRYLADAVAGRPAPDNKATLYVRRYFRKGHHRFDRSQTAEQAVRDRDTTGAITHETRVIVHQPEPTLRQQIQAARAARRTRRTAPAWHAPTPYPGPSVMLADEEDTTWRNVDEWSRELQKEINNNRILLTGAEGPLAR